MSESTFWLTLSPWKGNQDVIVYWKRCPKDFVGGVWYGNRTDVITWQPRDDARLTGLTLPDDYRQIVRHG